MKVVWRIYLVLYRTSHLEVFLKKYVLKVCSKFTGEHPCQSAISIKLQSNFIEITFRHGCSPVNLLLISRTPFLKNTSGWLPLAVNDIYNLTQPTFTCSQSTVKTLYKQLWNIFKINDKNTRTFRCFYCHSASTVDFGQVNVSKVVCNLISELLA